jgi:hypothetical protein
VKQDDACLPAGGSISPAFTGVIGTASAPVPCLS